jgi:hypothetical protein
MENPPWNMPFLSKCLVCKAFVHTNDSEEHGEWHLQFSNSQEIINQLDKDNQALKVQVQNLKSENSELRSGIHTDSKPSIML